MARTRPALLLGASFCFGLFASACDGQTTDPDATVLHYKRKPCLTGLCFEVTETGPKDQRKAATRALACQHNSDCRAGLSCENNYCVAECNENRDCDDGQICRTASHGFGECVAGTGRPGIMKAEAELVMDAAAKRARACLSQESIAVGREVRMHVTAYGQSGKVKEVVLPGSWENTHEGACMRGAVAKSQFSPFDRDTQSFWYVLNPAGEADPNAHHQPEGAANAVVEAEPGGGTKKAPSDAGKLSAEALTGALAGPKRKARDCFAKVKAAAGTSVAVHMRVDGKTGLVAEAKVDPPHAGTPLGTCVASELAKAEFPAFEAETQSFAVKLRAR